MSLVSEVVHAIEKVVELFDHDEGRAEEIVEPVHDYKAEQEDPTPETLDPVAVDHVAVDPVAVVTNPV